MTGRARIILKLWIEMVAYIFVLPEPPHFVDEYMIKELMSGEVTVISTRVYV